VDSQSGGPR